MTEKKEVQVEKKRGPGRPPEHEKWLTPEGLKHVELWAKEGLWDYQIAYKMGISKTTMADWKNQFPELVGALEDGRNRADVEVENAMFKSATGQHELVEETYVSDGEGGLVLEKRVVKKQPANTSAQIFWAKNRQPDLWRDKQEIDNKMSGEIKVTMDEEMEKWSQ